MKDTGGILLLCTFVYFSRTISDLYRPRIQTNGLVVLRAARRPKR